MENATGPSDESCERVREIIKNRHVRRVVEKGQVWTRRGMMMGVWLGFALDAVGSKADVVHLELKFGVNVRLHENKANFLIAYRVVPCNDHPILIDLANFGNGMWVL